MKKIFYVLTLAAVVATAACSDDEKGMSEEQLYQVKNNDWTDYGLFGSPKRMDRVSSYDTNGIGWDSVANKPAVTPAKKYSGSVVEFNSAGFETLYQEIQNVVTGVEKVDEYHAKVTSSKLAVRYDNVRKYDSKNRMLSSVSFSYNHTAYFNEGPLSSYGWEGDTVYCYSYGESGFVLKTDTTYSSKREYEYGDKTATVTDYSWVDGDWKATGKNVYTLNKYGFMDDNSSSERFNVKPTATEFESKPSSGSYKVLDGQGNWKENYSFYKSDGYYYLSYYETRDIAYY